MAAAARSATMARPPRAGVRPARSGDTSSSLPGQGFFKGNNVGASACGLERRSDRMPDNIVHKVLGEHLVDGRLEAGGVIAYRIDQVLLQDATGTMAWMEFEQLGKDRVQVPLVVQYVDHNMIQLDYKNPDDHFFLQGCAARYGATFSRPGNGILHYVQLERFDRPYATLVGSDSHSTTAGAMGMAALGIGGMDAAVVMAGHPFELQYPSVVRVVLENELRPWISAKDV